MSPRVSRIAVQVHKPYKISYKKVRRSNWARRFKTMMGLAERRTCCDRGRYGKRCRNGLIRTAQAGVFRGFAMKAANGNGKRLSGRNSMQKSKRKGGKERNKQVSNIPDNRQLFEQALTRYQHNAEKRLLAWHSRPRLHPSVLRDEARTAELVQLLGSIERVEMFRKLAETYQEQPTLENYLRLRRDIPEAEIDVGVFAGLDQIEILEGELNKHEVLAQLVVGSLNAYELSLRLMECLVARDNLPNEGPGHITRRRNAISDTLVAYLIAMMLEAIEWNKSNPIVIPSSLIVLIRDRLCGASPDLRMEYLSWQRRSDAASLAAEHLPAGEKMTVRKLAKLTHVGRSTAQRWLDDPKFHHSVESARRREAGETPFHRLRKASRLDDK
jgi:hypothetical protein